MARLELSGEPLLGQRRRLGEVLLGLGEPGREQRSFNRPSIASRTVSSRSAASRR